jgi:hypothetical protein
MTEEPITYPPKDLSTPDPYFKRRFRGLTIFRIPSDPDQTYHELKDGYAVEVPFNPSRQCWGLRDASQGRFYTQSRMTLLKLFEDSGEGGLLRYLLAGLHLRDALQERWPPPIQSPRILASSSPIFDLSDLELDL